MFGLNRLTRLAFDLVALSTIIAGIKKSTGFALVSLIFSHLIVLMYRPATSMIQDNTLRRFLNSYFALGETIFGMMSGFVVNSKYFKRTIQ